MDLGDVARAILSVQIHLNDPTGGVVMAGNAFAQLSNEGIEGQHLGATIDRVYELRICDDIDLTVQHV